MPFLPPPGLFLADLRELCVALILFFFFFMHGRNCYLRKSEGELFL